jgi:hypothetical protein
MLRLPAVLALLLAAAASTSPARACTPARPTARVRVSFLADSDLAALAKWAQQATCVEYTFERALASRRLGQGVILTVAGRDVGAIFEILLHSMNLKTYGHGAKLSIVADGPETAQSRETNEREKADLERDKVMASLQSEIKRKDDSHYTITRRGADALIANIPSIARTMRVATETKGGKRIGYRLLGLKSGNPLTYVGLQNGDVVLSLGGSELTAPDKALAAYAKFRTAGVLMASILRGNQTLALELKLEP